MYVKVLITTGDGEVLDQFRVESDSSDSAVETARDVRAAIEDNMYLFVDEN